MDNCLIKKLSQWLTVLLNNCFIGKYPPWTTVLMYNRHVGVCLSGIVTHHQEKCRKKLKFHNAMRNPTFSYWWIVLLAKNKNRTNSSPSTHPPRDTKQGSGPSGQKARLRTSWWPYVMLDIKNLFCRLKGEQISILWLLNSQSWAWYITPGNNGSSHILNKIAQKLN